MSLFEQQNFLAKLYTDARLRRDFTSEPLKIGGENNLTEIEIQEISEIFHEEINFFAESLLWKRLKEAEKLLPLTRRILNEDFEKSFREFAGNYKPQTIKKHLADSVEFCRFLQARDSVSIIGKDVAKFEEAKLRFFNYGKRFVICRLKFDMEEIFREDDKAQRSDLKIKTKYAVWLRYGNKIRHFYINTLIL